MTPAQWSTPDRGGYRVEVDASHCIVIVQPRLNAPDVRMTVTNVDALTADLDTARTMQQVLEDQAAADRARHALGVPPCPS
jgi:hypothetical protein